MADNEPSDIEIDPADFLAFCREQDEAYAQVFADPAFKEMLTVMTGDGELGDGIEQVHREHMQRAWGEEGPTDGN